MSEKFNGMPVSILHFNTDGKITSEENYNLDKVEIADWQVQALARSLLPGIQESYSHEENVCAFEEWQREQSNESKKPPKQRKRKLP